MKNLKRHMAVILIGGLVSFHSEIQAETGRGGPPVSARSERFQNLTDAEVNERIAILQNVFDEGQARAKYWYHGWLWTYGILSASSAAGAATSRLEQSNRDLVILSHIAGAAGSDVAAIAAYGASNVNITDNDRLLWSYYGGANGLTIATLMQNGYRRGEEIRHFRQNSIVNAWSSFLGFASLAPVSFFLPSAADRFRTLDAFTSQDRRMKLASGEDWLEQGAAFETEGRSWLSHALVFAVGALSGAALTEGYGRPARDGYAMFASSLLVSEIQIFTQPTRAIDDWSRYRSTYGGGAGPEATGRSVQFHSLALLPGGFRLTFVF